MEAESGLYEEFSRLRVGPFGLDIQMVTGSKVKRIRLLYEGQEVDEPRFKSLQEQGVVDKGLAWAQVWRDVQEVSRPFLERYRRGVKATPGA
jgi:hypothetical protein